MKEYRKRLSWVSNGGPIRSATIGGSPSTNATPNHAGVNKKNDFRFEFPKFGDLPATVFNSNGTTAKVDQQKDQTSNAPSRSASLPTPAQSRSKSQNSVPSVNGKGSTPSQIAESQQSSSTSGKPVSQKTQPNGYDNFNGLFSPSILEASRNFEYFPHSHNTSTQNSSARTSQENAKATNGSQTGLYSRSSVSNSDSPSGSSDSQRLASSLGTSPEPSLNSPGNKTTDFGLNTINEENQPFRNQAFDGNAFGTGADFHTSNDFNWLAQQNGGSFDPVLFGDYRESQDAVVGQDFGSFFNDAFPLPDLGSPFNSYNEVNTSTAAAPKTDLMKQVDAAQNGGENVAAARDDRNSMMTCNRIWYVVNGTWGLRTGTNSSDRDRLQSMDKFRNGEIDVDNLCSELRAKARCSEGGAVLEQKDVDKILGSAK